MHSVEQDLLHHRKARGAFFTPGPIADFLAGWAVRQPHDRILEPSCGEAEFLMSAGKVLRRLGVENVADRLHGVEIHAASAHAAALRLATEGLDAEISVGDFFDTLAGKQEKYDVVIGNPPYVRYQNFSGLSRASALQAALRQGVRLNQLASSWAAFTVHAAGFLNADGRLALVLPAELLSVQYAAQVREFLLRRFATVRLVQFDKLVFPGIQEDVLLLMAEGSGGASHFEVHQAKDAQDLAVRTPGDWIGFTPRRPGKWTNALLPAAAVALYEELVSSCGFELMADWGDTYLGTVTGKNDYFTLSQSEVQAHGFDPTEVTPISPPGSRHLCGLRFSSADWTALADAGERCFLFTPGRRPSLKARRYIEAGEEAGVAKAYKCRMRTPWWHLPPAPRPDLVFTYMSHERPRLLSNDSGAQILNSLYGIRLHASRLGMGGGMLAIAFLNSVTLLGAEVVGRAYGGGMLKHEPREVGALPVPSWSVIGGMQERLHDLEGSIEKRLLAGDVASAVDLVDGVVLKTGLKMSESELLLLREARAVLRDRRMARRSA